MVLTFLEGISRGLVESFIFGNVTKQPNLRLPPQSFAIAKDADSVWLSQIALS
jgi:hypothetical protein